MLRLILASASPRRRELLALSGWPFEVCPVAADETPLPHESPRALVQRLSALKARVAAEAIGSGAIIIGADTTVAVDKIILNKPAEAAEAFAMLRQLRGRAHSVFTGLTLLNTTSGESVTQVAESSVLMRAYSDEEMQAYVASGDPLDKAGAYAIQHPGFQPVEVVAFRDCFANVMGLPLCHVLRVMRRWGDPPTADVPAACQDFIPYTCPVSTQILNEALE